MKSKNQLYGIVRQIHLYSSLLTVALLLMYIITSYMMINHEWFKVDRITESPHSMQVSPQEILDANWHAFLEKNNIRGRLIREDVAESGDMVRTYSSAGGNTKITISQEKNLVEINSTKLNRSGRIIGLHRLRGYGGPILYNIYALLLDILGISLILFAVTGVIMWLKLLKYNKIAWIILILGFVYVGAVIGYLVFV